ncbi:Golgi transport complex subunit 1 [Globomyces sp. JEL0801]|nr:Golgi transport complex subunit 1 [Globomyces sp. JEL0801]
MQKVDADNLFKKHSLHELKDMLVKIKADADRKKHDLRSMVGDSYRDVIDAADAIGNMKSSTELLLTTLKETDELCKMPKESQVELINDNLSGKKSGNYLNAGRIFLIARLVFANLQSPENPQSSYLKSNFPVIKRQWEVVGTLKSQIVDKVTMAIQSATISKRLLEGLSTIGILENISVDSIFRVFLAQRQRAMIDRLAVGVSKDKYVGILSQIVILLHTTFLEIIDLFFPTNNTSRFVEYLPSIVGIDNIKASSFVQLYSENSNMNLLVRYLPIAAKQFTPKLNGVAVLDKAKLIEFTSTWMTESKPLLNSHILKLLTHIDSANQLCQIAKELYRFIEKLNLQSSEVLFGKRFGIWNDIFHQSFLQQTKNIISDSMTKLFLESNQVLNNYLGESNSLESDVAGYVWREKYNQGNNNLETLSRMNTPAIVLFGRKMEGSAVQLHNDLVHIIQFYNSMPNEEQNRLSDLQCIFKCIESALFKSLNDYKNVLQSVLKTLKFDNDANKDTEAIKIDQSILVGRISRSISTYFDRLDSIFKKKSLLSGSIQPISNVSEIFHRPPKETGKHEIEVAYDNLYLEAHETWFGLLSEKFGDQLKNQLHGIDWRSKTNFEQMWEEINRIEGFTMDQILYPKVLDQFLEFVSHTSDISETGYLQILFDFKYCTRAIGLLESQDESTKSRIKTLEEDIITKVILKFIFDYQMTSFDFTTIDPHLEKNIIRCYSRSSTLFNSLYLLNSKPQDGRKRQSTMLNEQHLMLVLAPTVNRLNLIPVPNQYSGKSTTNNGNTKRVTHKLKSKPHVNLNFKQKATPIEKNLKSPTNTENQGNATGGRVMGIMNAVSGLATPSTDILANATSFLSSWSSKK